MGGGRDVDNAPSIGKYGYDEWCSTWESPDPYPKLGIKFAPWDRRLEPGQVPREKRTEFMVDKTLDFISRHKDQPWYVDLCPDDVHTPHRPGKEMAEKYGGGPDEKKTPKKNFKGVLDEYDIQIGRLLAGLKKLGVEQDTIVIFTSDNGCEPSFKHQRSGGLRGMKLSLYEGGIREPFIVRWPGHVPKGYTDSSSILSGVDMLPTLSKLAGAPASLEVVSACDGQDVSAALLGKPVERDRPLLWEYGRKPKGYGYPGNKYDISPNVAIREKQWKLLVNDDGTSAELYNIEADKDEKHNVASMHTTIVDDLSSRALAWRATLPHRRPESVQMANSKFAGK
jgi:arylsulfatase A-like enzyme